MPRQAPGQGIPPHGGAAIVFPAQKQNMNTVTLVDIPRANRAAWLPTVLDIWEASVRATHDFLSEEDIAGLRPLVRSGASAVSTLVLASTGIPVGFMGVEGRKIEMLFLHPAHFGRGTGRALVEHAIQRLHADAVDCNEQNTRALAFYRRMGFAAEARTADDGHGNAFPLLHMRLARQG